MFVARTPVIVQTFPDVDAEPPHDYSMFGIAVVVAFGLLGYAMKRLDYPAAPLLFGFVLGPMVEDQLRRALLLGHGDPATLVTRPVGAAFLAASVVLPVLSSEGARRAFRKALPFRGPAFESDGTREAVGHRQV